MFYRFIRGLLYFLTFFAYRKRVLGRENIPEGAAVVCCCHTSITDPIFAIMAFGKRDPLRIMLKKELMSAPVLSLVLKGLRVIPVNRELNDVNAVKSSINALKSGQKLLIFPEGTRVRPGKKVAPKTGAVLMACRTGVPLLPVYVTEGNKPPFSRVDFVIGAPYTPVCDQKRPPDGFYDEQTAILMKRIFDLRDRL
jgi:1-acyl-sn-glycerol-3-phosphate acyltransferase